MKLSKRLEAIVDTAGRWVSGQGAKAANEICAADVGTDHGFVPICLVERGIVGRALALDVGRGPLFRAQEHVRQRGLQERIELRLGDGLSPIHPGEAQLVILTGMGGGLMLRILKENEQIRRTVRGWIFSPQAEQALFRHGLEELRLAIREEEMIKEDGKYYTVMTAEPGEMHYQEEYLYRFGEGRLQRQPAVLKEYLEQEIGQLERIRRQLLENTDRESRAARKRLKEVESELWQARTAKEMNFPKHPETTGISE